MRLTKYLNEEYIKVKGRTVDVEKPPRSTDQKLVYVKMPVFDKAWKSTDKEMYIGKGGKGAIGTRYEGFEKFILGGSIDHGGGLVIDYEPADSIEVSEVYVREDGKITFTNGRTRYAWLRDNGLKKIPVVMPSDAIKNAKKFNYV